MSVGTDERNDFDDDYAEGLRPHRGSMILAFGIMGVMSVSCLPLGVFGIIAWIMGKGDLQLIRSGQMDKEGESLTRAGYIMGIVGTIVFLLYTLFIVAYIAFFVFMIATH
jgi:hypothetical protein